MLQIVKKTTHFVVCRTQTTVCSLAAITPRCHTIQACCKGGQRAQMTPAHGQGGPMKRSTVVGSSTTIYWLTVNHWQYVIYIIHICMINTCIFIWYWWCKNVRRAAAWFAKSECLKKNQGPLIETSGYKERWEVKGGKRPHGWQKNTWRSSRYDGEKTCSVGLSFKATVKTCIILN